MHTELLLPQSASLPIWQYLGFKAVEPSDLNEAVWLIRHKQISGLTSASSQPAQSADEGQEMCLKAVEQPNKWPLIWFLGYNDEYGHTHIKQLWSRQICDLYTLLCSLTFKLSWSSTSRGREPQLMKIRKLKNLKTFEDFCLLIQLNSVATCSSMSHMGRYQLGTACTAPGLMCANYANLI